MTLIIDRVLVGGAGGLSEPVTFHQDVLMEEQLGIEQDLAVNRDAVVQGDFAVQGHSTFQGSIDGAVELTGSRKALGLPTSDPHVAGEEWVNAGIVMRSAG